MGGVGAYRNLSKDDPASDEEIKRRQQAWRRAHPATVKFWGDINYAAIMAVQNRGQTYKAGRWISFHWGDGDFLRMRLPNGRELAYPFPHLVTDPRGECAVVFKDSQAGKWGDCRHGHGAYGGTWTENAVQAASRDLLVAAMPRLEAAGYPIVMHVHDEIIAEVPIGFGSEEEFLRLVTDLQDWAAGLPVAAKFRAGPRFCKVKGAQNCAVLQTIPRGITGMVILTVKPAPRGMIIRRAKNTTGAPPPRISTVTRLVRRIFASIGFRRATGSRSSFRRRMANSAWVWGKPPAIKIPYRLPELIAAPPSEPVFICEGEKDADNVAALGFVATTNPGGALKWTRELNRWFAGRKTIYVLEDNDPPSDPKGQRHAREVAEHLRPFADEVLVVSFPELNEKGDVSDWLARGGTAEQLLERAKAGRGLFKIRGFNPADWEGRRAPLRLWDVPDYIPHGTVALLYADGGTGKGYLNLQLAIARAVGLDWIGLSTTPGRTLVLSTEDDLRMYFSRVRTSDGNEPDKYLRTFQGMKSNYGDVGGKFDLEWRDGLFQRVEGASAADRSLAEEHAEGVFITLLKRLTEQGRHVTGNVSPNYAPTVFADEPGSEGIKKQAFAAAMKRLFAKGKIRNVSFGLPSRQRTKLEVCSK